MKKPMTYILLATMTSSLWANEQNQNQNQNQNQTQNLGNNCSGEVTSNSNQRKALGKDKVEERRAIPLTKCDELSVIALMNNSVIVDEPDSSRTSDGKVTCKKKGGYTVDYNDCNRVLNLYNGVFLAEQAMFAAQKIKLNESNIQQNKDIAAASAKGDLQYGAIEAVQKRNELNAKLYKTQATTYTSAVGALSAGVTFWQGKKSLKKLCKNENLKTDVENNMNYPMSEGECEVIAEKHKKNTSVFANIDARAAFVMQLGTLIQKAAEARRLAGLSEKVGERLDEIVKGTDEETTAFDPCMTNSLTGCKQNGPKNITGGKFNGSKVNFGSAGGTNTDFNMNPNGTGLDGDNFLPDGSSPEKVADLASPFEDAAREASGILDPAGAASVTPGSQSSAPGGGGGGGGGGGSASLGDDLAGATADDNSDPDIKTNKVAGKYKSGGGGFQGVGKSGGKDGANPFASMFDSKGEEGGIEEDRSIAGNVDGEASGLFEKISKKYGQVQQEKRLDSQNLE